MIVCQYVNLSHTYGHCPQKQPLVIWYLSNSSKGSQTYSNHMELQFLIDTTNFIKTKNHFNHFLIYLHFLVHSDVHCFCHKYTLELYNISWKKKILLQLNSLCYNPPYYANHLEKYPPILPWLKFKHGHPWKIV